LPTGTVPSVRSIAIVAANLAGLVIVLELAGVAVYGVTERGWFYGRDARTTDAATLEASNPTTRLVLHPVLGFIGRPGLRVSEVIATDRLTRMSEPGHTPSWTGIEANNYGFFSPRDYPHTPDDSAFVVGVFGGSVAQWLTLQASPTLAARLETLPAVAGRRVEILNFAQGGFKQPQQVQTLAYFLAGGQPLDVVVNLDGFNEVALASLNLARGVDPLLPSAQQLLPLVSLLHADGLALDQVDEVARARRLGDRIAWLQDGMSRTRFAGGWLLRHAWCPRRAARPTCRCRRARPGAAPGWPP
jgi:hypothetical protein